MNLQNQTDVNRLKQIAMSETGKFGQIELCDDFIQFAAEALLRGRKATVKQLFTDFIREEYGDSRYQTHAKISPKHLVGLDQVDFGSYDDKHHSEYNFLLNSYKGTDRVILVLYFEWDMSLKEIGHTLGISEGRVSQILKTLTKNLRKRYLTLGETK